VKIKYFSIFIYLILFQFPSNSQTVRIDDISVSIDDSLEQVIPKFQKAGYDLILDTLKQSIRCTVFKNVQNAISSDRFLQLIGYLHFSYLKSDLPLHYTKSLFEIEKIWSNPYENNIKDILIILNNILEKNSIDKYSINLQQNKTIEPEYTTHTITIQLNSFTRLEIYSRDDGYFEIIEVINNDEHRFFSDEEYVLIFEDYKHYYSKNEYVIEYFKKEDEAERRERELLIKYILDSSKKPESRILRFYKDRFYFKNK